jgi:hypothetical protein
MELRMLRLDTEVEVLSCNTKAIDFLVELLNIYDGKRTHESLTVYSHWITTNSRTNWRA